MLLEINFWSQSGETRMDGTGEGCFEMGVVLHPELPIP